MRLYKMDLILHEIFLNTRFTEKGIYSNDSNVKNMFWHLDSSILYTVCFKNRNFSPVITYYTKKRKEKIPPYGQFNASRALFFLFSLPQQLFWVSDVCERACLQLNNVFSVYLFLFKGVATWSRSMTFNGASLNRDFV